MPEQFENGRKLDGENSLQDFDAKEMYLHPKNRSVSFQKCLKMFCFYQSVYTMPFPKCAGEFSFQNLPFSKCAGKKCAVFV